MKKFTPFILIALLALVSTGCKKVSNSKKVAEQFYSTLTEHDYENILPLLSDDVRKEKSDKKWKEIFNLRDNYWGTVKSYDNTFSEIKQTSIGTVVELKYKVENTNGSTYELLSFREENGEMKVIFYSYSDNPDYITKPTEDQEEAIAVKSFPTQEKTIQKFYDLFKLQKYEEMLVLFSDDAKQQHALHGLEELMIEKTDYYGEISKSEKYFSDTLEFDSEMFYVIIYKLTYKSGEINYEKFEFSCDNQPDKINYYKIGEDTDEM
jgi:hypothetical protein